jgi:hypothetical protein
LRRFLPEWQKNSQRLLLGNKDGKVSYLDVSFLDPYDHWKKAFGAFVRSLTARDDAEAMERNHPMCNGSRWRVASSIQERAVD